MRKSAIIEALCASEGNEDAALQSLSSLDDACLRIVEEDVKVDAPQKPLMTIHIANAQGKVLNSITVTDEDSIADVKAKLNVNKKLHANLLYDGVALKDNKTIKECQVVKDCVLTLLTEEVTCEQVSFAWKKLPSEQPDRATLFYHSDQFTLQQRDCTPSGVIGQHTYTLELFGEPPVYQYCVVHEGEDMYTRQVWKTEFQASGSWAYVAGGPSIRLTGTRRTAEHICEPDGSWQEPRARPAGVHHVVVLLSEPPFL